MQYIWIVACEGKPVGAYTEEAEANLFALRASGLMQLRGFSVAQVILYGKETSVDKTVFTAPAIPDSVMTFCS